MDDMLINLTLPHPQAARAQRHLTHNAALERLDMIVQQVLQSLSKTTPPIASGEEQVWAIGTGAEDSVTFPVLRRVTAQEETME